MESLLLDAAGHRRSPATIPGYHHGRAPRNKGLRYPADPPTIEEIVAVMRAAGDSADGARLRALIVILCVLACGSARRSISLRPTWTVRAVRSWFAVAREAAAARSAWTGGHGINSRRGYSSDEGSRSGRSCASSAGRPAGRHWEPSAARKQLRRTAALAGVRRQFAPHQLRHAHAVEMAHEGVPLVVIQRQLGHANLGITSVYLQGIDSAEIIDAVHSRPAPVISAAAGLADR